MNILSTPLDFQRGPSMKNRFMLAPLTNQQSHKDGTLSNDELRWLTMRAEGGFGLTMTCAVNVQANGQGWPGELGAYDDKHIDGLSRLATGIKAHDSLAMVQLFHGGLRSPNELINGQPVAPSDHQESGARGLSHDEVLTLIDDFIEAAVRCEKAGFDGVELHSAHGYIICQFLSPETNQRQDEFGGNAENRARVLTEIISGIRQRCSENFTLGVRLSPERYGLDFKEMKTLAQRLMAKGQVDFLDMSLWDVFKEPEDQNYKGKSLIEWYAGLDRHTTKLGVAGNIRSSDDVMRVMEQGVDFAIIGRSALLHHDFANQLLNNPSFEARDIPVSESTLRNEGLSDTFINYLKTWPGFVRES
ncbi:NADH:flavin oxidoreductase [Litoribrevibacter albus]|uniref:NADH-dependent flavin oxidoreductase YqiG n=1 Tax=Litoribrevibacter albus TaxID=1473156 RepID=A0AA37S6C0_9GAMM|nr:NADH:flavin oxidoreductase [Litoribrevibacter albus]GLQ30000.1 putative NADH-dependent flavin oxidoreductase YqiG [Litoribrevibacter albus]